MERNAGEPMTIKVTTSDGRNGEYLEIVSVSSDAHGSLHIFDAKGPRALYSAESGWALEVL